LLSIIQDEAASGLLPAVTYEQVQRFVQSLPGLFLVVRADEQFTIVAASDDYLQATHTDRGIVGQPMFTVFPDNPDAPHAKGGAQPARLVRARARHACDRHDAHTAV
jgi:hypothetical protein